MERVLTDSKVFIIYIQILRAYVGHRSDGLNLSKYMASRVVC